MGRTFRARKKNKSCPRERNLSNDSNLINFMQWMTKNEWTQLHKFRVSEFLATGRGILTKENIRSGDCIVKIPEKLLITLKTVSRTDFFTSCLDLQKCFSTQQLLAAFLIFQKHLGKTSFWYHYIESLPRSFSTPIFHGFIDEAPSFLSEKVARMSLTLNEQYNKLIDSVLPNTKCYHCDSNFQSIFNFNSFKWAWCAVNTRAVYISPDCSGDIKFSLTDVNCLALAPYLDLFNHSNNVEVKACVTSDGSYEIRTLTPFKKYNEIFINYGQHSNLKLYLEYGFVLKSNINDSIPLTLPNILQSTEKVYPNVLNSVRSYYNYLKTHDLLKDPSLNSDGLSWSASVVIFILISSNCLSLKLIEFKVYSNNFNVNDLQSIKEIALLLIDDKRKELKTLTHDLENLIVCKEDKKNELECVGVALELVKEYLNVLDKCQTSL